jgi:lipid II isoglutaminyl synthase (glutamine-hydrolysing)
MTERKDDKGAVPQKPPPRIVATVPVPTDYQIDPSDPFPFVAAVPQPPTKPARRGKAKAAVRPDASGRDDYPDRSRQDAVRPTAGDRDAADRYAETRYGGSRYAEDRYADERPGRGFEDGGGAEYGGAEYTPIGTPVPVLHTAGSSHSRDHKPLRIAHLYPSLLNVAGDGGNLMALQRRAQWRGIPVDIVAVEKGETPDFRTFDIVLFHGGQDVEMAVAAADFAHKAPSLREAVADGVVVFAVCAGLQLLGHRYVSNDGQEMLGAGILDLQTRGGPQRFMQHAACEVTIDGATETIVGFENHSGLTDLGPGCEPFGKVIAGAGNNGRDGFEGARFRNVFATYLHGPCLPKNPRLTDHLIRIAVGRAEGVRPAKVALAPLNDELENGAHEIALAKAMANRGRRTALEPARLVRDRKP